MKRRCAGAAAVSSARRAGVDESASARRLRHSGRECARQLFLRRARRDLRTEFDDRRSRAGSDLRRRRRWRSPVPRAMTRPVRGRADRCRSGDAAGTAGGGRSGAGRRRRSCGSSSSPISMSAVAFTRRAPSMPWSRAATGSSSRSCGQPSRCAIGAAPTGNQTLADAVDRADPPIDGLAAIDPDAPDPAAVAAARAKRPDPVDAIKADVTARLAPKATFHPARSPTAEGAPSPPPAAAASPCASPLPGTEGGSPPGERLLAPAPLPATGSAGERPSRASRPIRATSRACARRGQGRAMPPRRPARSRRQPRRPADG